MSKKLLFLFLPLFLIGLITLAFSNLKSNQNFLNPSFQDPKEQKSKPLAKYTIEALARTNFAKSKITLADVLEETPDFTSRLFYFYIDGKKVSGLINLPQKEGIFPVIVMFRGYIDRENYQTGDGTKRAGQSFAKNGFITLAPDFLGYGQSGDPSTNAIKERFQTYTTAATLLESVNNLNEAFANQNLNIKADPQKVGIWGHSNGGQIAQTILEITGRAYPTVLWAPVSKPFPYSILYYTDDFDDHGKALRKLVADFEKDYDVELYSLTNYFEKINHQTPIQLHQGTHDEAVPLAWSNQLVKALKEKGKDIEYFTYTNDDHNFTKGAWKTVVNRNTSFYQKHFKD